MAWYDDAVLKIVPNGLFSPVVQLLLTSVLYALVLTSGMSFLSEPSLFSEAKQLGVLGGLLAYSVWLLACNLVRVHARRWPFASFANVQISKTMQYYDAAEGGIAHLHPAARWPVWSALIVYRKILDAVAANGYDNISTRAYVPKLRKMVMLPYAYACASFPEFSSRISRAVPF